MDVVGHNVKMIQPHYDAVVAAVEGAAGFRRN